MTFLGNARKGPKRILVDVSEDLHKEIKIRAMIRNVSIKDYVVAALTEKIFKEKQYD